MKNFTFKNSHGQWRMEPQHLKAIRMDMGLNMVAMAKLLEKHTTSRISRDRYRSWERPKSENDWPYIPRHIAEAVEGLYKDFYDFVDTLVAMWDGEDPLVMVHRNDMFDEAQLPLPRGITVDNYNQAVGKAWGRIMEQGYLADLAFFTTETAERSTSVGA